MTPNAELVCVICAIDEWYSAAYVTTKVRLRVQERESLARHIAHRLAWQDPTPIDSSEVLP